MNPISTEAVGDAPAACETPAAPLAPTRRRRRKKKHPDTLLLWRTRQGVSQREAALALGISQTLYSRLERRTQVPDPPMAQRLRVLTGLSLEHLLGIDEL